MKTVILAGGLGTRLAEETISRPKPMVEIGGRPILWHIMKMYSSYGLNDFVICCGYKGHVIKEYFYNYALSVSDVTIDLSQDKVEYHRTEAEPWRITLADTGLDSMTGGRLRHVRKYLDPIEPFCFTYGDGVGNIDINALIAHHKNSEKQATVTAVEPPGRYGALDLHGDEVRGFKEKPGGLDGWINGGFFVLSPTVIDLIEGDATPWEGAPLNTLARTNQLSAFCHNGFWQPMDTLRDKKHLEALWADGKAPWKMWS